MKNALKPLLLGDPVSDDQIRELVDGILSLSGDTPSARPEQIAAALGALGARRDVLAPALSAFASSLRNAGVRISLADGIGPEPLSEPLIDTCGTGGDGSGTFNISTTSALVLAASGVRVAKHGNRSISSSCGSADVLEALGVAIELEPEAAALSLRETGFAFLFAPRYHPSLARLAPIRKSIGVPTVFNFLGPLLNPAPVSAQVLGVSHPELARPMAEALLERGLKQAMVVCSDDGLDEISLSAPTRILHLKEGRIVRSSVTPEEAGFQRAPLESLRPPTPGAHGNAAVTVDILNGKGGPKRNIVLLNAAAGLLVGGKAESWKEGVSLAARAIDSGAALEVLSQLRERQRDLIRSLAS